MDEVVLHGSSVHGFLGDVPSSERCSWSAMIKEHAQSVRLFPRSLIASLAKKECLLSNAHAGMHSHRCNGHSPAHTDWMFMRMGLRLGRYLCGHMRVNVWPCEEAMSLSQKIWT